MEERNPLFALFTPNWFLDKYPHIKTSLNQNQDRLATNFDAHATMMDISSGNFLEPRFPRQTIRRGMSMFLGLPENRTCHQAGIPDSYCLCGRHETLQPDQQWITRAAQSIIDRLNELLAPTGTFYRVIKCHIDHLYLGLCQKISLKSVQQASLIHRNQKTQRLRLQIVALPHDAIFDALLRPSRSAYSFQNRWEVAGEIQRLNVYWMYVSCMKNTKNDSLVKYCSCL